MEAYSASILGLLLICLLPLVHANIVGPFKGKALRIGLMGSSSSERNVMLVLAALENILGRSGATEAAGVEYAPQ